MENNEEVLQDPSISDLRSLLNLGGEAKENTGPTAEPATAETKTAPESDPETTQQKTEKVRDEAGKFKPAEADANAPAKSVQKRIDELTKLRYDADRRAETAQAELARIQASQPAQKNAQPGQPMVEPKSEDFDSYEAYNRELVRFTIAQDRIQQAQQHAQDATQQAQQHGAQIWQERVTEAKASHADFDQVMQKAATLPVTPLMHAYIEGSEVGPKMAYKLATDPELAAKIFQMQPVAQARALVALESSVMPTVQAAPAGKKPARQWPKPPAAVGGGSSPTEIDLNDPDLSVDAFKKQYLKLLRNKD